MEAKRSHYLPSASKRPSKASDVVPVHIQSPEKQNSQSKCKSPKNMSASVQGQEEMDGSAYAKGQICPLPPFSIPALNGLVMLTNASEYDLFYRPIQMLVTFRNTLTDTPRDNEMTSDLWHSSAQITTQY